eukprot:6906023-Prymnesium_polylepis.1
MADIDDEAVLADLPVLPLTREDSELHFSLSLSQSEQSLVGLNALSTKANLVADITLGTAPALASMSSGRQRPKRLCAD